MAVTTSRSTEVLARFDRVERVVHWTNAILFSIVIATASALYVGPISAIVGRRELVRTIHVYCGLALFFPITIGLLISPAFRGDLRRFNRWTDADRHWFRKRGKVGPAGLGKFNPGQKANAAFTAGVIVVMAGTGSIMKWFGPFPLSWRTGATFVHDWVAFAIVIVIIGHIRFALSDRDSLGAMWRGTISSDWAARHAPLWHKEMRKHPPEP